MPKGLVVLTFLILTLSIFSIFWYVKINQNTEDISINNKSIEDLNNNINAIAKDKDSKLKEIEKSYSALEEYQLSKQELTILEVKVFLEYVIFWNNNSDNVDINLTTNTITYMDDNIDNVLQTMKLLEDLQKKGTVSDIKNEKIELKEKFYYKTTFEFTLGTIREYLKSKPDTVLEKLYNFLMITP